MLWTYSETATNWQVKNALQTCTGRTIGTSLVNY
jgi:hypothetical protein